MPAKSGQPEVIRLADIAVDPVSSVRSWGADVSFGGQQFHVPAMDAAGWLELLLADPIDFEGLFPGLAGPQAQFVVNQMMIAGDADGDDLERAILDLVEAVSGRSWWVTLRLCYSVRSNWVTVGGEMARHGMHPWGMPLGYWLDGAYSTMIKLFMEGPKPKQAADWSRAIALPPPSENRQVDDDANTAAFFAAFRQAQ